MRRRSSKSISFPITLASVSVAMAVAMLLGWILLISRHFALTRQVAQNTWLLIAGVVSLATIITVLVLFTVILVGEILQVRRQTSFIDSVTHELKSPLASLSLCLQTLARPELSAEHREQLRTMMSDAVERLSLFINDILEASLLAHGRGGLPLADVGVADLVARCVTMVGARYRAPEPVVTIAVAPGIHLFTDATALETVLKNLLDNAIKYSPSPARIEVRAWTEPGRVAIAVRDHGIGVPRRQLKRIFDRFYRVPTEDVRSRHGTGLGLFVASSLVRNLGGRIAAHSDGAGQGTTLTLWLPTGEPRARA